MKNIGWTLLILGFVLGTVENATLARVGWLIINCAEMVSGATLILAGVIQSLLSKQAGGK